MNTRISLVILALMLVAPACSKRRGRNPTVPPLVPIGAACTPNALFAELPGGCSPGISQDVAFGDLDGDGDLDAIVATIGQSRLLLQTASGRLRDSTNGRMPTAFLPSNAVALADVDGDGDLDIVLGNTGQSTLYLNDGTARFDNATEGRIPSEDSNTFDVQPIDADGDGDVDFLIANAANCVVEPNNTNCTGSNNLLLVNNGSGRFAVSPSIPGNGDTRQFAIGDLDGDSILDAFAAEYFVDAGFITGQPRGQANEVRLATGGGDFPIRGNIDPRVDDLTNAIALGDVDGDGDLDAFFANETRSRLVLNDGSGNFFESANALDPAEFEVGVADAELVDLDGDGDLDLLVTGTERPTRAFANDGTGTFTTTLDDLLPPIPTAGTAVVVVDIDGDGDIDVYVANGDGDTAQADRVLLNDGGGKLAERNPARLPQTLAGTQSIAAGDINGDLHIDLVFGTETGVAIFQNSSAGVYQDRTADLVNPLSMPAEYVVLADFDRDGDLDLAVARATAPAIGQPNGLFLNAGDGSMSDVSATHLPGQMDPSFALGIGDVDGDGNLDMVVGNVGANRLYLNGGAAGFVDATASLPARVDSTEAVVMGDVDLDGDVDIVVGNTDRNGGAPQNRILINNGTGQFADETVTRLMPSAESTNHLILGDVDGDGDLDLFAANSGVSTLSINDGSGVFVDESATRLPLAAGRGDHASFVDADGDNDLDILLTANGLQNRILINNGAGAFSEAPPALLPSPGTASTAFAVDVDLDQDVDLVFATASQTRLLINRTRQFEFVSPARLDEALHFEVTAAPGSDSSFQAVPVAAVLGASPPVFVGEAGFLQVDPLIANKLATILVGPPTNVGIGSIQLPNDPNLIGESMFMQVILLEDGTDSVRLTNLERMPFVP